jgi:hypothetical protein
VCLKKTVATVPGVTPASFSKHEPGEFDSDDCAFLRGVLLARRITCEPHERFALDRLIDLLTV